MSKQITSTPEEKLDFKKIMPVFVVVLVDLLGLTIIIPLLPLYAAQFRADAAMIGLLGATYPILQFIGAPLLGRLSDRFGRKPILIISQIGTFAGFVLLGFAQALPVLFLSRALDGLSGANISTAQAIIADSTNEKTRTQGLGLIGAAFGLGFVLGPVIAFLALAVSGNDYHAPAFMAAGFSLLSIVLSWRMIEESHPAEKHNTDTKKSPLTLTAMFQALAHPGIGLLMVLIFAQQIAFGGFEQLLSLFTLNRLGMNASGNTVLFVFVGVVVVMVQGYYIGKWSRRFGERKLIYAGLALLTIGLAIMALTPAQPTPWYSRAAVEKELTQRQLVGENPTTQNLSIALPEDNNKGWLGLIVLLVAMIPAGIGGGVLQPSINSLITKRIDANERGGILGISAAFVSAANAIAPVFGGALFAAAGATAPMAVWAVLLGLLFVAALVLIKPGPEEQRLAASPAQSAS